jgi:hypothetical protein
VGGGRNQVCNEGFTDLVRSIGLVLTIIGKIYYWVRPVRVCAIVGRPQNKPVGGKYSIAIPRAPTCLKPTVDRGALRSACTGPILRKLGNPLVSVAVYARLTPINKVNVTFELHRSRLDSTSVEKHSRRSVRGKVGLEFPIRMEGRESPSDRIVS